MRPIGDWSPCAGNFLVNHVNRSPVAVRPELAIQLTDADHVWQGADLQKVTIALSTKAVKVFPAVA